VYIELAVAQAPRKRGRKPGLKNKLKVAQNTSEDATGTQAALQAAALQKRQRV
jgi:hypothetical protein